MRSEFLLEILSAHYQNDDSKISMIVDQLVAEERKKGNNSLADRIIDITKGTRPRMTFNSKKNLESKEYAPSSGLVLFEPDTLVSPRDRTNNLSLFDLINPEKPTDTIILSNSIREKIKEIILEFSHKDKIRSMGLPFENRILLCGPPGCGKTSSAKMIAYELNLPLALIRLDSLISSFLGQTGTNLRKIFEAVNGRDIVLFLDEFDAIAKQRDDKQELGELKRVVNTLLQNIDSLSPNVFVIAATNHEKLLDSAVWRRFNTVLYLDLPDSGMRVNFLKDRLSKYDLHMNVDFLKIAEATNGLNFSEINEIIFKTIKKILFHDNKRNITTDDFLVSTFEVLNLYRFNKHSIDKELIARLRKSGLTIRAMAELLNVPRTTLSDWIKKEEKNNGEKG